MTRASGSDLPPVEKPRLTGGQIALGCGALVGVVLLVLVIGVGLTWLRMSRLDNAALAEQVAQVRARGEPLTTVELNDHYQPVANRPDMTKEIMAALVICEAPSLKPLAASLPVVGQGAEIPPLPQPWPQQAEVEAFLVHHREAIATFHEVARKDGTARFPVDFSSGFATLLPQTQSLRSGARVLTLQFQVHLHRGETSQGVDCILAEIALAGALDREPLLVSQLVRLAIMGIALRDLQTLVEQAEVSDADLLRLQAALRKMELQSCLKQALAGERTVGYMACVDPQRMGAEGGGVTPQEAQKIALRPPQRVKDAAKMLELNLRIAKGADESLFAALRASQESEAELKAMMQNPLTRLNYMLTLQLMPAYSSSTSAFARAGSKRDCAEAAIAAEVFRRQQGKWPSSLEELVPEFLPTLPLDSFSNQPLKLAVTPEEFKVYSVGRDGKDDGGVLTDREEPDMGFVFPLRKTGETK